MSRKIFILVVATTLFHNSNAFAWGWRDTVNQAINQNPLLLSQKQAAEIGELRQNNARSLMFPVVTLEGGFRVYQDQTESFRHQLYLGPSAQYLLYQGGKVRAGIEQAKAQSNQADLNVQVNSITVNAKLHQAFAVALREKKYLDLSHRIEQQRQENLKFTKIRYESGLEYKWVFLNSSVKWQQAQLDVQLAEMNKKTALADLESLVGKLPIDSVLDLSDEDFYTTEANYDLDQLLAKIDENPKYQLQESNVKEAEAGLDYNKGSYYPRIALLGEAGVLNSERQELVPLNDRSFVPYWVAGAALTMPLYEGKRIRRNVAISKAVLSQRKFDQQQTKLDIITSLKKTFQMYVILKQQVEISKASVEAALDRSKVVANQYKSGLATFLEWESSQDVWVSTEIQLLNDVRDYQTSRAKLEEAMGTELGEL